MLDSYLLVFVHVVDIYFISTVSEQACMMLPLILWLWLGWWIPSHGNQVKQSSVCHTVAVWSSAPFFLQIIWAAGWLDSFLIDSTSSVKNYHLLYVYIYFLSFYMSCSFMMWSGSEFLQANHRELHEGGGMRVKELTELSTKAGG